MSGEFDLDDVFALHEDPQIWVEKVAGRYPVLYIEPFYRNPDLVREYALSSNYDLIQALYPGRHSVLAIPGDDGETHPALTEIRAFVAEVIAMESGIPCDYREIYTDFSVITTPPQKLLKHQKHPHTDPNPILALIYLNPVPSGGTSLYRNKVLDLAAILTPDDNRRLAEFMETAPDDRPQDAYDMIYTDLWERLYTIEGRYNCFAGYPPCIPHWAENTARPDPADRSTWRLTQRVSIQTMPVTPAAGSAAQDAGA